MKPSLQLNIGQHLTLTPQLQQAIRLLQLSAIELNQEVQEILDSNPLLERESTLGKQDAPTQEIISDNIESTDVAMAASNNTKELDIDTA